MERWSNSKKVPEHSGAPPAGYKNWDSPTAATERNTEEKTHYKTKHTTLHFCDRPEYLLQGALIEEVYIKRRMCTDHIHTNMYTETFFVSFGTLQTL